MLVLLAPPPSYDRMDVDEEPPPTPSNRHQYAPMPGTPTKRRVDPRGILLGT